MEDDYEILEKVVKKYNENHKGHEARAIPKITDNVLIMQKDSEMLISIYDFLYNPRWGFAEAIWGRLRMVGKEFIWQYSKSQMVKADNHFIFLKEFVND